MGCAGCASRTRSSSCRRSSWRRASRAGCKAWLQAEHAGPVQSRCRPRCGGQDGWRTSNRWASGEAALKYLANYLCKPPLHESPDSKAGNAQTRDLPLPGQRRGGKRGTVSGREFVRRFLQHVLPKGFQRVRHYGWLGAAAQAKRERIAALLDWRAPAPQLAAAPAAAQVSGLREGDGVDRLRWRANRPERRARCVESERGKWSAPDETNGVAPSGGVWSRGGNIGTERDAARERGGETGPPAERPGRMTAAARRAAAQSRRRRRGTSGDGSEKQKARETNAERTRAANFDGRVQQRMERTFGAITHSKTSDVPSAPQSFPILWWLGIGSMLYKSNSAASNGNETNNRQQH